jgi:Animal haem peroxidase
MTTSERKPGPTRRQLFSRAAAAVGTGVAAQALPGGVERAAAAKGADRPWGHAVGDPRGSDIAVTAGRSAEARFGLMFKQLAAFAPPDPLLVALANSMEDPREPGTDPSTVDEFDNPDVPAGFTFLGQFIDHDMTRDTTPLTDQQADPKGLRNFDTPLFDLGSVYGGGPTVDKALYEADGKRLKLRPSPDGTPDLPRAADGTAFVGDPRNDENHIVAQIQIAFIRLHNTLVAQGNSFATARRLTQWRFHWIIINDYLPHIVGPTMVEKVLQQTSKKTTFLGKYYKPKNPNKPMMPLEYAVCAFRFGHSMIRPEYEMHDGSIVKIFGTAGQDLRGSNPLTADVKADWNYFFEIPGIDPPDDRNMSRRMDTKLSKPLFTLPLTVVPDDPGGLPRIPSLGERNLLRGKRLGMPAGQDVARAMGVTPLTNAELGLTEPGWGGKAPLWFYVLKEAELKHDGSHLGEVGGRIVAETILGILARDKSSYLNVQPSWRPAPGEYRMGDLLLQAGAFVPGEFPSGGPDLPGTGPDTGA